jgi:hypothetical protein
MNGVDDVSKVTAKPVNLPNGQTNCRPFIDEQLDSLTSWSIKERNGTGAPVFNHKVIVLLIDPLAISLLPFKTTDPNI